MSASITSVAPLAGARIEIPSVLFLHNSVLIVAPLAGARIEIMQDQEAAMDLWVAPLAGARIEIKNALWISEDMSGRSPRGSAD